MPNPFKRDLKSGKPLYGFFNGIPHPYAAEICAGAGFDWVLVDMEHAPFDLHGVLVQFQAMARFDVPLLVRPPAGDPVLIKQLLDIGVQNLFVPMVESAEQATQLVQAMRYPPAGIRGIGTGMARAAQWGRVQDYFEHADEDMCLIVQVESRTGLDHLDAIAQVEDVDCVLIGPADLSASLGYKGQPTHPDMVDTICKTLQRIRKHGKAAGVMAVTPDLIKHYVDHGANMIVTGVDSTLLAQATQAFAASLRAL